MRQEGRSNLLLIVIAPYCKAILTLIILIIIIEAIRGGGEDFSGKRACQKWSPVVRPEFYSRSVASISHAGSCTMKNSTTHAVAKMYAMQYVSR